ncbi:MAG: class I adenylate-forming enzyme family protein, partial [Phycisphaerae bacterium]
SRLAGHVRQRADVRAVADPTLALSYSEFDAVCQGLAQRIQRDVKDSFVGIMAPSSAAGAVAIIATWYAGKIPIPLNFLLAERELASVIADAEIRVVLTIRHFATALEQHGLHVIEMDAKSLIPGTCAPPDRRAEDLAVVLYTSGTSGLPKGVCLTFDNITHNARAAIEAARMTPDQVFLSVLPQFHSFGFTAMSVVPLWLGATVYYLPRFSPVAVVETIRERNVSIFMAIPSMYAALLKMKSAPADAFLNTSLLISGGEPLPQSLAAAFNERFHATIHEGYGMTETSPIVSLNAPHAHRAGSVGRALPGIGVIARDEAGNVLNCNQTGELQISGHCVMKEYLNQPQETARILVDGKIASGDIGHVDDEGYIFITGRAKDLIIVAGENVYPREIEDVLREHPAVADAAVVGRAAESRGEVPVAYVELVPERSASSADLRAFCKSRLAGFKVPREVVVVEELPRSATGKVLKRALGDTTA